MTRFVVIVLLILAAYASVDADNLTAYAVFILCAFWLIADWISEHITY